MTTAATHPPAATREAYGPALVKLAEDGYDIVALDADLSASDRWQQARGVVP